MTTPAQNIRHSRYVSWESTWQPYPWMPEPYRYSGTDAVVYRIWKRPQSVNSPVRPDGTRAPTYYKAESLRGTPFTGRGTFYNPNFPGSYGTHSGNALVGLPEYVTPDATVTAFLANNRLRALEQWTESSKELNAFMAQANQTGRMVGKAASRFAHGLDNLMQGPKGLLRRFGRMANWRQIPGEYLEFCYGWSPLGDDIANAFDRLGVLAERTDYMMRVKLGCRRAPPTQSLELDWRNSSVLVRYPGYALVGSATVYGTREAFTPVQYTYMLPNWVAQNVPDIAPFSTLYELMPYSFVLDWFVPVGSFIGAFEASQIAPFFSEGSETWFIRDTYHSVKVDLNHPYDLRAHSYEITGRHEVMGMVRIPVGSHPSLTRPRLQPLPGIRQASQGLSLLAQAFKRWQ